MATKPPSGDAMRRIFTAFGQACKNENLDPGDVMIFPILITMIGASFRIVEGDDVLLDFITDQIRRICLTPIKDEQ